MKFFTRTIFKKECEVKQVLNCSFLIIFTYMVPILVTIATVELVDEKMRIAQSIEQKKIVNICHSSAIVHSC